MNIFNQPITSCSLAISKKPLKFLPMLLQGLGNELINLIQSMGDFRTSD